MSQEERQRRIRRRIKTRPRRRVGLFPPPQINRSVARHVIQLLDNDDTPVIQLLDDDDTPVVQPPRVRRRIDSQPPNIERHAQVIAPVVQPPRVRRRIDPRPLNIERRAQVIIPKTIREIVSWLSSKTPCDGVYDFKNDFPRQTPDEMKRSVSQYYLRIPHENKTLCVDPEKLRELFNNSDEKQLNNDLFIRGFKNRYGLDSLNRLKRLSQVSEDGVNAITALYNKTDTDVDKLIEFSVRFPGYTSEDLLDEMFGMDVNLLDALDDDSKNKIIQPITVENAKGRPGTLNMWSRYLFGQYVKQYDANPHLLAVTEDTKLSPIEGPFRNKYSVQEVKRLLVAALANGLIIPNADIALSQQYKKEVPEAKLFVESKQQHNNVVRLQNLLSTVAVDQMEGRISPLALEEINKLREEINSAIISRIQSGKWVS